MNEKRTITQFPVVFLLEIPSMIHFRGDFHTRHGREAIFDSPFIDGASCSSSGNIERNESALAHFPRRQFES